MAATTPAGSTPSWPLGASERQLLGELATLIARGGAWRFLYGPVVAANATDYPDRWEENLAGVARVVARSLWHAHVDLASAIEDVRVPKGPTRDRLRTTQLELARVTEARAEFLLTSIGNDDVAGIVSHEIGRAFVAQLGRDGNPFRGTINGVPDMRTGSIATIYLGLGVIATNSARHDRSAGETIGRTSYHEHVIAQAGGLDSRELAFLLAVQAAVRSDVLTALDTLRPTQAMDVTAWRELLEDREVELFEILGMTDADLEAEATPRSAEPRAVATSSVFAEGDLHKPNLGRPVFRYERRRTTEGAGLGTIAGVAVGVAASVISLTLLPVLAIAPVLAGFGGGLYGRRQRFFKCASCDGQVTETDATCARCGGRLVGEIKHPNERLEKEEEFEEAERKAAAKS